MQPVIVLVTRALSFTTYLAAFFTAEFASRLTTQLLVISNHWNAYIRAEFHLTPSSEPRMKLVETLELLSKAREYVAQGQEELIEQREIVDQLERCGHDPLEAILFLEDLEDMQDVYAAHMDRLERQVMSLVRPD